MPAAAFAWPPCQFSDPGISELFGDAGCDFTWIDMEHYPIDLPAARGHFMAVRGTLAASLNRVLPATPMCSSRCWSCTRVALKFLDAAHL